MTENTGPPVTLAADRSAPPAPGRPVLPGSLAIAFRLAAHLAAWIPFVIGAIRSVQKESPVISDSASIALRSWDALTPYGPLVGQATQLRNGAYDPGPLQYWLLAIPVHLDPRAGVVWGAALCCLVAAEPEWNPWFGVMFFLATLATGLAVLSGRRRWWPVLVVTASVAAQAHLMFALASAALVLVALVAAVADTIRARAGYWWAVVGLMAGAACWIAPFIQQITGRPGNLRMLIASLGTRQPAGTAFGLKALSASVLPPTVGWRPAMSFRLEGIARVIGGGTPAFGVAVLALTAALLGLAGRPLRSRRLAARAVVC